MYLSNEDVGRLVNAIATLRELNESEIADSLQDIVDRIKVQKKIRSNRDNIRNKKKRGTYKGE